MIGKMAVRENSRKWLFKNNVEFKLQFIMNVLFLRNGKITFEDHGKSKQIWCYGANFAYYNCLLATGEQFSCIGHKGGEQC